MTPVNGTIPPLERETVFNAVKRRSGRLAEWLVSDIGLRIAAIAALFFFFLFLVLRIGILPAASSGDDVWVDESAYWLLHEGALRRHIHANMIGDSVRDFLPPLDAILTAVSFKRFGLTQFAVGFVPTFASATGLVGAAGSLRNRFGLPLITALGLATIVFYAPDFLRVVGHNRFEAIVFLFIGLGLFFGSLAPRRQAAQVLALVIAGVCAGGAAAAHYPVAPLSWSLVALWSCWRPQPLKAFIPFCVGTGIAGIAGLLWIGPDIAMFLREMQYDHQHSFTLLSNTILVYLAVALAILALVFPNRLSRWFAILGVLFTLAMVWWSSGAFYGAVASMIALVGFACGQQRPASPGRRDYAARALLLLLLASVSLSSVIGTAHAVREYPARNFAAFRRNLLQALPRNNGGLVIIGHTAHLALRACYGADQMHHLLGEIAMTPPSTMLLDPGKAGEVQAIILEPNSPPWLTSMPLYKAFLARPHKEIDVSPFGIGPGVRHSGPYRVTVYLPINDTGPRLAASCT
jgi:hypothetical protein